MRPNARPVPCTCHALGKILLLWCHRCLLECDTYGACCCQVLMSLQAQAMGAEWAAGQQMDPQLLQQMIQQHAQGQPQLQDPNVHLSSACGHQLQIAQ